MSYIGNKPALNYTSFAVQHFTTSATTGYTLDHAVTNENDIRLVINNVVQQPGGSYAYTAAGTVLTLSVATAGTDTMYCVFIGKAVQTVNPGAASVGTTALTDNSVTLAKMASGTDGNIISYDASGNPVAVATGSSGQVLTSAGAGAAPSFAAASGTTINNNADNRVITGSGTANTLEGEANFTFDGTSIYSQANLKLEHTGDASRIIRLDADRGAGGNSLGDIEFMWNGNINAKISGIAGADTTNKDDANLDFYVRESGSALARAMTINKDGVVGIGAANVADQGTGLHIRTADSGAAAAIQADELVIEGSGDSGMTILTPADKKAYINFGDPGDGGTGRVMYQHDIDAIRFLTGGSDRMSIRASQASSGTLAIGGTSFDTWYLLQARFNGNSGGGIVLDNSETDTNGTAYMNFKQGNSSIGYIFRNGTTAAVVYSTSSDYRLKENVNYDFDATTRLKELKPAKFNWISDPSSQIVDGFLAHEVSNIVPEAIVGTKDETETKEKVVISSDGKIDAEWIEEADWIKGKEDNTYENDTTWEATKVVPKYQAIDQSKLVPLLVKTIQELEARITALENA